jgi:hypothetical protein
MDIIVFRLSKLIDVVWDVVIGRGGQFLLAFFSTRVFTRSLLHSMEERAVSYSLFSSIAFYPLSMESIMTLCRERFGTGLHGRLRVVGVALVAFYVVGSPTLLSAVTGYTTDWISYVSTYNGTVVQSSHFDIVEYTIAEGIRIELKDDKFVYGKTNFMGDTPSHYDPNLLNALHACRLMSE